MTRKESHEDWEGLADTPEKFDAAIRNSVPKNEKEFFEKLSYKVLNETAFSNAYEMNVTLAASAAESFVKIER